MKRLYLTLLTLCSFVLSWSYTNEIDGIYYNLNHTTRTAQVTYGDNNYSGNITIPQTVFLNNNEYTVTSIGYQAFCNAGWDLLNSLTLPETIEEIEMEAFAYMGIGLKLTIPKNVKTLGHNVFGWNRCDTIIFNAKCVKNFGQLWYDCSTKVIIIGPDVDTIPSNMFNELGSLEKIEMHNNVKYVGTNAVNRTKLKYPAYNSKILVAVPKTHNTNFIIPEGIEVICAYAFEGCTSLPSVIMPYSVKSIGERAFFDCGIINAINLPSNIKEIGSYAFNGCGSLSSITIPETLEYIGDHAFSNCPNLTSVTWNAIRCNTISSDYYNNQIFDNMIESFILGDKIQIIPDYLCYGLKKLTSIIFPNSLKRIGEQTFSGCSGLTSVTIPNSVEHIGWCAFCDCSSLVDIYATCSDLDRVRQLLDYDERVKYIPLPYSIIVNAENGYINHPQSICDALELSAIPNYGYHFTQWSDGNTNNPRPFELTQDTTFTAEFAPNQYSINVSCDEQFGHIDGENGEFDYLTEHVYEVVANYGYHFVRWSNGSTNNPYTVTLKQDTVLTAKFAKNKYTITDLSDSQKGYISGIGKYEYLDKVVLKATPRYGYHFTQWSDGKTDNPRTITLTQDTAFIAVFDFDRHGKCGDNLALTWEYDVNHNILTIKGDGTLNSNYTFGIEAPEMIEELVIAEGVTTIGNSAFANKATLQKISLPTTLKTVYEQAFYNCTGLQEIYSYREKPSVAYSNSFDGIDKFECTLHVLTASLDMYKVATGWRDFYYVQTIDAEAVTESVTDVTVTPSVNTADVIWPAVDNAVTYELTIKDKNSNVICTLVFNANGQLTSIAFGAPGRTQTAAQVAGFTFTVTGLDSGNSYSFTMEAKDSQGEVIDSKEGSFTTTSIDTAVDNTSVESNPVKVLRNGQLFILREGKSYSVQGLEVR